MPDRKLEQEKEKVFKQVLLGVEAFDEQYRKYEQSTNPSQRDKLVENIKRECKKLQRLRDQIKGWAAGNDFKDKAPLQEKRELIETKMEAFKAVEKEMKTKAFSKEGLSAAAKLDPREQEKQDLLEFLDDQVGTLDRQVEDREAELVSLQPSARKSKKDASKSERIAEVEHTIARHKWHVEKLERLKRLVDNDEIEVESVKDVQDSIKDYVENNQDVDFYEDDTMYDDFELDSALDHFGIYNKDHLDKTSSHEDITAKDEDSTDAVTPAESKAKGKMPAEQPSTAAQRRPSSHTKSPMPALATLSNVPPVPAPVTKDNMKPAPAPKPLGEPLKYASAAAAATAQDKAGIGIAPLPPPPGVGLPAPSVRSSTQTSPANLPAQLAAIERISTSGKSPALSHASLAAPSPAVSGVQPSQALFQEEASPPPSTANGGLAGQDHDRNAVLNGVNGNSAIEDRDEDEEPQFHLPPSLQELVEAYTNLKEAALPVSDPQHQRELEKSFAMRPNHFDMEKPNHYRPENPAFYTPPHYPQEPLGIFNDPRLYQKIDTDSLFYSFYYRQGTYQQYLAAQALKQQSWRFHKQYQTWFQRHDEPKNITEDYEQGTYRFFDYESTWMNRRKQDFKFAYKFLEDDL